MPEWTIENAAELYGLDDWGGDFFGINALGNLTVKATAGEIDLKKVVDELRLRGIDTPILVRLLDTLENRVRHINHCFAVAMDEYEYQGEYRGVYPVKANQQRHVLEKLLSAGRPYHLGVEVGSKPELLAAVAMVDDPDGLIICNGFKDESYLETALLSRRIQEDVVIVLDRPEELGLVLEVSRRLGSTPKLGVRCKLSTPGSGRWRESGGDQAKFGLTLGEIIEMVRALESAGLLDTLMLLHFHIGSQISDIVTIKGALNEAARVFVELHAIGAPLTHLDVGGGLGVNYTGYWDADSPSSVNYETQEYANDVVYWVREVCNQYGVPHPTLVTESGRALVAQHSVLVFDVLGATQRRRRYEPVGLPEEKPLVIEELLEIQGTISEESMVKDLHDVGHLRREFLNLFRYGILDLRWRAVAEQLYVDICSQLLEISRGKDDMPGAEEIEELKFGFADIYYGNFSLFQSLPDSWAVGQEFPVMPIHRLLEEPTEEAVLADLTCDSDGKIDHFIGGNGPSRTLLLHQLGEEGYFLAAFFVGAYQEILGDLHNLFGDTNAVSITVTGDDDYAVDDVVEGETVSEVLRYVEFSPDDLVRRMRRRVDTAVRQGRMGLEQSRGFIKRYIEGLRGYTYLEREYSPTDASKRSRSSE